MNRSRNNAGSRLGAVHIIESLAQGELRTGERLFDTLQPLGFTLKPHIETRFARGLTRPEFMKQIANVRTVMHQTRRPPIIHIEAHGHFDGSPMARGFELASSEVVT